jgi:hypothetical protein
MTMYRTLVRTIAVVMILMGFALLFRTFQQGGFTFGAGVILGLLFIAAGVGRLLMLRKATS